RDGGGERDARLVLGRRPIRRARRRRGPRPEPDRGGGGGDRPRGGEHAPRRRARRRGRAAAPAPARARAARARRRVALGGKTARHNFELLSRLEDLARHGRPVMIGVSRKSFLAKRAAAPETEEGTAPELPVDQRLAGGLAASAVAVFLGARIVRTHDVLAT